MKRLVSAALTACAVATFALSAISAQRVRIIGPEPARPAEEKSDAAEDPNAVQPEDPTPEERDRIAALIEQLGDRHLVLRDRAMSELAGFEARALGQVREAKQHDDDEIANRCHLLEEVIMSRQGELFLAARRLNLSIEELNLHLNNQDVAPLLSILRTRAQPGMVHLWASVLARMAGRSEVFPTAQVCREVEGTAGYGQAVAKAARAPEAAPHSRNLLLLLALMPPGEPADTVEALTQLRFSIGEGRGLEQALNATEDFRGVYTPEATLAATGGRPDPNVEDPEGAAEVRAALALAITSRCTVQQLAAAELPAPEAMSPMLLGAWLGLLQRSGLTDRIGACLRQLLADKADARRITIAAGAWAGVAGVQEVMDAFDTLPLPAQLTVLDTWWLRPREPERLHPFIVRLLEHQQPGIRDAGCMLLGQYRSASSARALMGMLDTPAAARTLQSLLGMADLLETAQLETLAARFPGADLLTRPLIGETLVRSAKPEAVEPLLKSWRENLPRSELPLAWLVLASRPDTPAGAFAAAQIAGDDQAWGEALEVLTRTLGNQDLELIRALLSGDGESGFALLHALAADENEPLRLRAMRALALADRDGELIEDWLKRLSGEIRDPLGGSIGAAVAFSNTTQADDWRRSTLQQGVEAANLRWVYQGVLAGRGGVTREELIDVLFSTPDSARTWMGSGRLLQGPLSAKAAGNVATALMMSDSSRVISNPGMTLLLKEAGVDLLQAMYGDAESPRPRDSVQVYATALLGEPDQARAIIKRTELAEDGSNFVSLTVARAWLGLLDADENRRLKLGISMDPTNLFGAVRHLEQAAGGDAAALYRLLDTHGPHAARFKRGATAGARMVDQRWGSPYMELQGVAEAAVRADLSGATLAGVLLEPLFADAPPGHWPDWWGARRGLLDWDEAAGRYVFREMP
jgi:hypothetical protein